MRHMAKTPGKLPCPHCSEDIPITFFFSPTMAHLGHLSKGKTSEAKKRASRENGKLGGRPKLNHKA